MTNLLPTDLATALPSIERDLAERRTMAVEYRMLADLGKRAARIARPALRLLAPRLAGAA